MTSGFKIKPEVYIDRTQRLEAIPIKVDSGPMAFVCEVELNEAILPCYLLTTGIYYLNIFIT